MLHSSLKVSACVWDSVAARSPIAHYSERHFHAVVGGEDKVEHLEDVDGVWVLIILNKVHLSDDKRSLCQQNKYSKHPAYIIRL